MNILPLSWDDMKDYSESQFKPFYRGIYELRQGQSQELYSKIKNDKNKNSIYICLLLDDESNFGHWVCIFLKDNTMYYFDPYGVFSLCPKIALLRDNFFYNNNVLQNNEDNRCGLYVLRECHRFLDKT